MSESSDDYWDLLAETARLQSRLGADLVAWSKMYAAGGAALQQSGKTLEEVSELGRRMQAYLESGPPSIVMQVMRMFSTPFASMGMPGVGAGTPPSMVHLWESWLSSMQPHDPTSSDT